MGRKQLFQRNALSIYISGIVAYYLATGLMNDHVNILQPYYAQTYGWSATLITMPVTVAGYVAIVMAAVFGVLYHKFSISRILGVSTLILGLSAIGLSAAGDHLALYSISLFLLRLMVLPLSLGIQYLCTNWFVESRGRALGIVTMGGPLCSATLVAILTAATGAFGFTLTYRVMGILVLVIGLLFLLLVKDKPEQLGLYPDGADHPPAEYRQDAGTMGLKELVHSADTYLIVLPLGLLWLCLVGIMAFFVPQMASTGTDAAIYLPTLTISAVLGMVLSYLVGVVDDKWGTPSAFLLLCAFNLMAIFGLLFMTRNNIPLLAVAAVGIAGMTGGLQNIQPSIVSYIYGRRNFSALNGWLYAFESIFSSFGLSYMSIIMDTTGSLNAAYWGMAIMTALSAVFIVFLWKRNPQARDTLAAPQKTQTEVTI